MNALKWTLALLVLCVALAPLIDASTEDEEESLSLEKRKLRSYLTSLISRPFLPDIVVFPDALIPPIALISSTTDSPQELLETLQCEMQVRVVHMPSDKGLVQQPSSALSRMLRVQV
ncbi:hypothetical protein NP493_3435g00005 [Ridgeia piscesae]|uniref:Uncharacterized protein n=1 Tax=Ridgeia piscesae TaxID=27915 RepID=A0AAD9J6T4_RIDPI|nr:hypothetical protein NP493_3435g00005 [Ridgeia piscesae]